MYDLFFSFSLGPAAPAPPTDVHVANVSTTMASIRWTVPLLTYTPEQYRVYYGTSQSSLTRFTTSVVELANFSSVDSNFSLDLTDLGFNTLYYFFVRASNTEDMTDSAIGNFTTLDIEGNNGLRERGVV